MHNSTSFTPSINSTFNSFFSFYALKDAGRGVAENITTKPGYEFWAVGGTVKTGGGVYNVQGDVIADSFRDIVLPVNFVTYWDGDLLHELLDHTPITKYNENTNEANVYSLTHHPSYYSYKIKKRQLLFNRNRHSSFIRCTLSVRVLAFGTRHIFVGDYF
ncbi:hypothetical protein ACI2OX_04180 [Bacillus sp. N9]